MVTFKEDRFIIEIQTSGCPIEEWMELRDEICDLLYAIDSSFGVKPKTVITLLRNLSIDWPTAMKMFKVRDIEDKKLDAMLNKKAVS